MPIRISDLSPLKVDRIDSSERCSKCGEFYAIMFKGFKFCANCGEHAVIIDLLKNILSYIEVRTDDSVLNYVNTSIESVLNHLLTHDVEEVIKEMARVVERMDRDVESIKAKVDKIMDQGSGRLDINVESNMFGGEMGYIDHNGIRKTGKIIGLGKTK